RPRCVSWLMIRQSWRWTASAMARYAGTIDSSWLAIMFHAEAGDDGGTLVEPPIIVRAAPPRALASGYAASRGRGLPSSAIASAWAVEKIRFLSVRFPTRSGENRCRNT